jgi:predicted AAA+ superfamily ATPase
MILDNVLFYNTKGKEKLITRMKYYAGDLGIANIYKSFDVNIDTGYRLENLVYLELIANEYEVFTFLDNSENEVDFVAIKDNKTTYIQVCKDLNEDNYQRESKTLLKIKDNHEKIILFLNNSVSFKNDGIKQVSLTK